MAEKKTQQPTRTGISNVALFCLVGLIPVGIFVGYFLLSM